ncbi:MAG TPA: molybdopterin-dependent oxidoreductase [Acidimicrobiia bacterium]|nr:molybdopterin-dependent oxidoreductase [Acidimicrobiia bacterium]
MGRRTNLALAILLMAAAATGLASQAIGVDWPVDLAVLHGMAALAVVLLAPWKNAVIRRGLAKKRPGRGASLALLTLVVVTLASGLLHSHGVVTGIGPLTTMQIHIGGAILTLALAVDHFRRHPVKPRRLDVDRRAFLRGSLLTIAAAGMWLSWEKVLGLVGAPGRQRRFTGSHERGSYDPGGFPVTSWLDDATPSIDESQWTVDVGGRRLTLADLESLPQESFAAVIDCTGGWYSQQDWSGVRLDRLVEGTGRRSFVAWSHTGYARRFPMTDLGATWLVTRVGGKHLSAGHGYPARIVAPGRRGFWWVKWVVRIETSTLPWWVQSPFPLT